VRWDIHTSNTAEIFIQDCAGKMGNGNVSGQLYQDFFSKTTVFVREPDDVSDEVKIFEI
jgi:hypothetical protein